MYFILKCKTTLGHACWEVRLRDVESVKPSSKNKYDKIQLVDNRLILLNTWSFA